MEKKTIGKFISVMRKANGMTQKELAERLHVSDKAVSRWERDESAPDLSLIPALAEMFDITADELLRGERNTAVMETAKQEKKTEKQLKTLAQREVSKFKRNNIIAIAIACIGIVLSFASMMVLSSGDYYDYAAPIGIGILFILDILCVVITILSMIRLRDGIYKNELFEGNEEDFFDKAHEAEYRYSAAVFLTIISPLFFSTFVTSNSFFTRIFYDSTTAIRFSDYTPIMLLKAMILPVILIFVLLLPLYKRFIYGKKLYCSKKVRILIIARNVLLVLCTIFAAIPTITIYSDNETYYQWDINNVGTIAIIALIIVAISAIIKHYILKKENV